MTFHLRVSAILAILLTIDILLVSCSLETILSNGVSAMVLFASEFTILLASIGGTTARYVIGLIDLRRARGRVDAPSWEEKSMWLFYVDLAVGEFQYSLERPVWIVFDTSSRFCQALDVFVLLHGYPLTLRFTLTYSPRRVHDVQIVLIQMSRSHSI
jgi:hypothetical protein